MAFDPRLKIGLEFVGRTPLVLAVDDDEDNLYLMAQFLDLFGCESLLAADGLTALFLAQNHQPDLILSDILLPDIHGLELIGRLRNNPTTLKIPVVAVTALAQQEDRQRILQAGCAGYLSKPYLLEDLEAVVNAQLSFRRVLF
ncbi:response regulator [Ancylothrix sp. C2]|nr:response regulator [Ancylothrix sp. D3o]